MFSYLLPSERLMSLVRHQIGQVGFIAHIEGTDELTITHLSGEHFLFASKMTATSWHVLTKPQLQPTQEHENETNLHI